MHLHFHLCCLLMFGVLSGSMVMGQSAGSLPKSTLDFQKLLPASIPKKSIYRQEGWCLWDPCLIKGEDGLFYLFYSRWQTKLGFEAWCTHAEIAYATSNSANGPFEFKGVALPSRGNEFWDGHSVYNTCIVQVKGKYYLYYTGNHGTANWRPDRNLDTPDEEWWIHRNNQRIGVAVADHITGPWQRFDKPLLDVGKDFGTTIIGVPNFVFKPDGGYRLYYKTLAEGPGRFGGGVFHYGADADNPLGPFVRNPEPMVNKNELLRNVKTHFDFHIDDHFEWYQNDRYYAIVKDHDKPFLTEHGKSLLLFESPDGRNWKPSSNILVQDFRINWDDGQHSTYNRLEMPKLLLQNGQPTVLSLAALEQGAKESYLVVIPLLSE